MKQSDVQIVQLSIQFLLLGIRNLFQFLWLSVGYAPVNELRRFPLNVRAVSAKIKL